MDLLAVLLSDNDKAETDLRKLMGDSRQDYEEKLRKRMEKRRKRISEGNLRF